MSDDISADLFLKNLFNLPSIYASLNMLEHEFIGFEDRRRIIDQAKSTFLIFCRRITDEIAAMFKISSAYVSNFDFEKLFLVQKLINLLDGSNSELLIFTKEKVDDMVIFFVMVEKNSASINFPENDAIRIEEEISIIRHQLHL